MDLGFLCHNEMCAHLHASGSQHKCRRNSPSVCDASCRNDRYANGVHNLGNQYHRRIFSDMSSGLTAFCNYGIGAAALHTFRQSDRGNHWNHLYTCFFPNLHVFLRISRTCGHYLDAFLGNNLRHLVGIWAH